MHSVNLGFHFKHKQKLLYRTVFHHLYLVKQSINIQSIVYSDFKHKKVQSKILVEKVIYKLI